MASEASAMGHGGLGEPPEITPDLLVVLETRRQRVVDHLGSMPDDWSTYRDALTSLERAGELPALPSKDSATK